MLSLYLFTYLSAIVFVIAIVVRVVKVASLPMHLRWELYPVAHEGKRAVYGGSYLEDFEWWKKDRHSSLIGELAVMLPEIFLLKALWKDNRKLWLPSFCLHHGVYWSAGMAILIVLKTLTGWGFLTNLILIVGFIGYTIGATGAFLFLLIRITDSKLRPFNSLATYFNLLFLLAIFASGYYSAFVNIDHFAEMTGFFDSLIKFSFAGTISASMMLHILFAVLFVLYLPFTHMTHFVIKYFTYHSIRWNDEPNMPGGKMEEKIAKLLKQPVTWSAKHIGADGKKNWVDIVTSEVPKNE